MHFQYITYLWPLLISAAITITLATYAATHRSVRGASAFAVCLYVLAVWELANALEMSGIDLPTKLFWANVQYFSFAVAPVTWFVTTLQVTEKGTWVTRPRLLAMLVIPLLTNILVWTNPWHGLVRHHVFLDTAGPFPVIGKIYGPWFWVHTVYSYLLNLASLSLLGRALMERSLLFRRQVTALFAGLLFILLPNFLYIFGASPVKRHDVTPVCVGIAGLIGFWGLFRFRLFDLVPVARSTVVERMNSAVIVLDARDIILDLNPSAERIIGLAASQAIGHPLEEVLHDWPDLVAASRDENLTHRELTWGSEDPRYYHAYFSILRDAGGSPVGRLIVAHDISERKRAQARLIKQQQALLVLEEREWLARELHDSLGQVLGYVNVQAQAIREMLAKGQVASADGSLARLVAVAQEAHTDVREFITDAKANTLPKQGFFPTLEQFLRRFQEMHGIQTELRNSGIDAGAIEPPVQVQLLRIIQEALTNVRKHATASKVDVSFSLRDGAALATVEDNGRGFDPGLAAADQSFGLRIMRERAEEVGGSLEISSAPGAGTRVIVQVPAPANPLRH